MERIFLGIGAQKAGTSWLHHCLSVHPEVWMPPVKELHFFNERAHSADAKLRPRLFTPRAKVELKEFAVGFARAPDARTLAWGLHYFLRHRDIDWYRRTLRDLSGGRLVGDITPAYSTLSEATVEQVAVELPGVRAVMLLRNPVDRAFSHAVMDLSPLTRGNVLSLPAERFYEHFTSDASVKRTAYTATIDRWVRVLGPERLFVAFYDELSKDPIDLLHRITNFIGVSKIDWAVQVAVRSRVNAGRRVPIPPEYHAFLSDMYKDEIARLAARYSPYPARWLEGED